MASGTVWSRDSSATVRISLSPALIFPVLTSFVGKLFHYVTKNGSSSNKPASFQLNDPNRKRALFLNISNEVPGRILIDPAWIPCPVLNQLLWPARWDTGLHTQPIELGTRVSIPKLRAPRMGVKHNGELLPMSAHVQTHTHTHTPFGSLGADAKEASWSGGAEDGASEGLLQNARVSVCPRVRDLTSLHPFSNAQDPTAVITTHIYWMNGKYAPGTGIGSGNTEVRE